MPLRVENQSCPDVALRPAGQKPPVHSSESIPSEPAVNLGINDGNPPQGQRLQIVFIDTRNAPVAPQPETVAVVLEDQGDGIIGHSLAGGEGENTPLAAEAQAAPSRADPQGLIGREIEGANHVAEQPRAPIHLDNDLPSQPVQTASFRADPYGAVLFWRERGDGVGLGEPRLPDPTFESEAP